LDSEPATKDKMARNDAVLIALTFVLASFATLALAQMPSCCIPSINGPAGCSTPGTCCQNATGLQNCTFLNGHLVGASNYPSENIDLGYTIVSPSLTTTWADLGPACANYALQYLCNSSAYGDGDGGSNLGCSQAPSAPNSTACVQLFRICGIDSVVVNFFGLVETATEHGFCFGMAPGMLQPLSAAVLAALMVATYFMSQHQ